MSWQTPSFVEIRMDAEISAYQDEFDPTRNPPVIERDTQSTESAPAPER